MILNSINYLEDIQKLAQNHGGILISNCWTDYSELLSWKCQNNHIFKASILKVKKGKWCPECLKKSQEDQLIQQFEDLQKKTGLSVDRELFLQFIKKVRSKDNLCKFYEVYPNWPLQYFYITVAIRTNLITLRAFLNSSKYDLFSKFVPKRILHSLTLYSKIFSNPVVLIPWEDQIKININSCITYFQLDSNAAQDIFLMIKKFHIARIHSNFRILLFAALMNYCADHAIFPSTLQLIQLCGVDHDTMKTFLKEYCKEGFYSFFDKKSLPKIQEILNHLQITQISAQDVLEKVLDMRKSKPNSRTQYLVSQALIYQCRIKIPELTLKKIYYAIDECSFFNHSQEINF
jgi:hypothetical protein